MVWSGDEEEKQKIIMKYRHLTWWEVCGKGKNSDYSYYCLPYLHPNNGQSSPYQQSTRAHPDHWKQGSWCQSSAAGVGIGHWGSLAGCMTHASGPWICLWKVWGLLPHTLPLLMLMFGCYYLQWFGNSPRSSCWRQHFVGGWQLVANVPVVVSGSAGVRDGARGCGRCAELL